MDDRKLLELAARAAGMRVVWDGEAVLPDGSSIRWNPLNDSAAAFDLAVTLGMNLYTSNRYVLAEIISDSESPAIARKEYCDADTKLAATRKAITRAAAAIAQEDK